MTCERRIVKRVQDFALSIEIATIADTQNQKPDRVVIEIVNHATVAGEASNDTYLPRLPNTAVPRRAIACLIFSSSNPCIIPSSLRAASPFKGGGVRERLTGW